MRGVGAAANVPLAILAVDLALDAEDGAQLPARAGRHEGVRGARQGAEDLPDAEAIPPRSGKASARQPLRADLLSDAANGRRSLRRPKFGGGGGWEACRGRFCSLTPRDAAESKYSRDKMLHGPETQYLIGS